MNDLELMLQTIGDLEFTRRKLLMEILPLKEENTSLKEELENLKEALGCNSSETA